MRCESCGCEVTDSEEELAGGHLSWDGCLDALKSRAEAAEVAALDVAFWKARAEAAEAELVALRAQLAGDGWRPIDDEVENYQRIEMRTTGTYFWNEEEDFWQDESPDSFPDDTEWRPAPPQEAAQ